MEEKWVCDSSDTNPPHPKNPKRFRVTLVVCDVEIVCHIVRVRVRGNKRVY